MKNYFNQQYGLSGGNQPNSLQPLQTNFQGPSPFSQTTRQPNYLASRKMSLSLIIFQQPTSTLSRDKTK